MFRQRLCRFLVSAGVLSAVLSAMTLSASALGSAPVTGDQSHLKLWIGLFIGFGVLLVLYLIFGKKNRRG